MTTPHATRSEATAPEPDTAHELRTALTAARGNVELIGQRLAALDGHGEPMRRNQGQALAQPDRMETTIARRLDGASNGNGDRSTEPSAAERRSVPVGMVRDLAGRVALLTGSATTGDVATARDRTAQIRRITATIEECNVLLSEQ